MIRPAASLWQHIRWLVGCLISTFTARVAGCSGTTQTHTASYRGDRRYTCPSGMSSTLVCPSDTRPTLDCCPNQLMCPNSRCGTPTDFMPQPEALPFIPSTQQRVFGCARGMASVRWWRSGKMSEVMQPRHGARQSLEQVQHRVCPACCRRLVRRDPESVNIANNNTP